MNKTINVEDKPIKGYKIFQKGGNGLLYCREYTFRGSKDPVGKVYTMRPKPALCRRGFHFCEKLEDCFNYYNFTNNDSYAICEVQAIGDITTDSGDKRATNKLKIVKVLSCDDCAKIIDKARPKRIVARGVIEICKKDTGCWWTTRTVKYYAISFPRSKHSHNFSEVSLPKDYKHADNIGCYIDVEFTSDFKNPFSAKQSFISSNQLRQSFKGKTL